MSSNMTIHQVPVPHSGSPLLPLGTTADHSPGFSPDAKGPVLTHCKLGVGGNVRGSAARHIGRAQDLDL